MKKFFALLLMLALIFSVTACGSKTIEEDTVPQQAEQSQESPEAQSPEAATDPERSAKEKAEETFNAVDVSVTMMAASHNRMLDYLAGFGSAYTADNIISYCKTELSDGYDFRDILESVADVENSAEYIDAADGFMVCVLSGWIHLRDYLEKGSQEDYEKLKESVGLYSYFLEMYDVQSVLYLTAAGFSEEEVNSMLSARNVN